jgi:hypothetical protein
MKTKLSLTAVVLIAYTLTAIAQDDEPLSFSDGSRHCITLSQVRSTQIVDEQHLVFRMKAGRKIFINTLRRRCPGLRKNDVLMFRLFSEQVCNIDIVTVLDDIGFGFSPGTSCSLGLFHPGTEDDVKALETQAMRDKAH